MNRLALSLGLSAALLVGAAHAQGYTDILESHRRAIGSSTKVNRGCGRSAPLTEMRS
jgi:hypothetical protein